MKEFMEVSTLEEVRAYSDPYRLRILNEFYRYGEPATSKDIADIMGEVPSKVYYHVKKMEKYGILVMTHTKEINGIIAKYYEPAAESIYIKGPSELNLPDADSQYEQLIASVFEQGKGEFIRTLKRQKGKLGIVSSENVFLTKEEYEDYIKYMKSIYAKKEKNGNKKAYYIFSGITEADNENKTSEKD
ncbi:MAG: helix-turn-helix domain-containing protein [Bacillota bacterium]|nr:helix-turn-helix domain-containing protein [Bacillota bacterium]